MAANDVTPQSNTRTARRPRRRKILAWQPGKDTAIAAATLLAF
ncbi:hypothetical protein [Arthrobacter sp. YC-RL1]|nr:hypothetical protein [Arthrobacter sp. YC-RL1]